MLLTRLLVKGWTVRYPRTLCQVGQSSVNSSHFLHWQISCISTHKQSCGLCPHSMCAFCVFHWFFFSCDMTSMVWKPCDRDVTIHIKLTLLSKGYGFMLVSNNLVLGFFFQENSLQRKRGICPRIFWGQNFCQFYGKTNVLVVVRLDTTEMKWNEMVKYYVKHAIIMD